MITPEILAVASQCRHYAMCKIDYLDTGLCPAGIENHFVSYYPQGRMDLVRALAEGRLQVTERLRHIADTCTLCGKCDIQCHFTTELRIFPVMRALKDTVSAFVEAEKPILIPEEDERLDPLSAVVGAEWVSDDPAILAAYAHDPGPLTGIQTPAFVALPKSRDEVAALVKLCKSLDLPFSVRGNGASVMGLVFCEGGLVMDLCRMRGISIDTDNWCARVEPGVSAWELQKAAGASGLRANVAEPAALVCANLMCSGIFSTFSHAYGTAGDNLVNAEFVGPDGRIFHLGQETAPNLFAFPRDGEPAPASWICTRADVRLHPKSDDEGGLLVPFGDFESAADFVRELGNRRIGLAAAVLGGEYISTFISATKSSARAVRRALEEVLGMPFTVMLIGDQYALSAVRGMKAEALGADWIRSLILGQGGFADGNWIDLVDGLEGGRPPFEVVMQPGMRSLFDAAVRPSPEALAETVDEDLRSCYLQLYSRPEMTDLVWLNTFRIISARMGREKHVVAFILYVPLNRIELIKRIIEDFERIASARNLKHAFGFLTPLDLGKRAVLEYDYFHDHTDPDETVQMKNAVAEAGEMIQNYAKSEAGVLWIRSVFTRGVARQEALLYT